MPDPSPDRASRHWTATARRWAAPVVTIALLAVTASRTIGPTARDDGDGPARLVTTFLPGQDSVFRNRDLWLNSVIVDGARARFESMPTITGWDVLPRWGSGMPALAEYRDVVPSAAMTLADAPDAVVIDTWEWPGTMVVTSQGVVPMELELRGVRGTVVAGMELTGQLPVLAITTLVLLILALRTGASGPGRRIAWLAISLAAWHAFFWLSQTVGTNNDSQGYLDSFNLMVTAGRPSYFPPGYALLVGAGERIAGAWTGLAVTAMQHALAVCTGLLTYLVMRRMVADGSAWWAGALAGGMPAVVSMSQSIMSEVPTMFAMVGAAYFALRSRERGSLVSALCSGLLTGWVVIARVVPLAAMVPALAILLLLPWRTRAVRALGVALGSAAAVILAPTLLFWLHIGSPRLTVSTGFHLFNRIVTEQRQLDENGEATRELMRRFGSDPRGIAWWDVAESFGVRDVPEMEAERLFARVALEGLRQDPWAYVRSTPPIAWREYRSDPTGWIPRWGESTIVRPHLENPPLAGVTATAIRWRLGVDRAHGVIWSVLGWLALAGTILGLWSRWRVLVFALAWIPMAYLYASASVEYFAPRHNVPVIPFVVMLAIVVVDRLVTRARRLPFVRGWA